MKNERKSSFLFFFIFVELSDPELHLFLVPISLEPLSVPSLLILGANANCLPFYYIESASVIIHFSCSLQLICLIGIFIL